MRTDSADGAEGAAGAEVKEGTFGFEVPLRVGFVC